MKYLVNELHNCTAEESKQKLSDVSSQEYIWILFNLCVQESQLETDIDRFSINLEKLNDFLKSGLLDDSNANADFYYYVGVLNSKLHQYDKIAQYYFDKSIELERDTNFSVSSAYDIEKYTIRFNKRCRKAYCTEYLGKPEQAITDLIGIDVDKVDYNISAEHKYISKQIIKLYNECQEVANKRDELLEKIISSELFKNNVSPDNSLFAYIKQSGIQNHNRSLYLSHIDEIIHILSHCMSEYCKGAAGRSNVMLFARLSEILMKSLGDKFVTCYATLKTENNDFATAYIELSRVKDAIKTKYVNSEYDDDDRKRLAEINFYIWYFSTISNYNRADKDICQNEFKDYCTQSDNHNSKVYYALFNLRSALQKSFENIKFDLDFQEKSSEDSEIIDIYNEFIENRPTAYCHNTIIDEWKKLDTIYKIHSCCDLIFREGKKTGKFFFELWSVIREYSNSFDIKVNVETKIKESNKFLITLKCGKFIYIGDYKTIESLLKKLGIQFNIVDLPTLYNPAINVNSNILVLSDSHSIKDIDELLQKGAEVTSQSEKYNIFTNIDITNDINSDIVNIYVSRDNYSLTVLAILFAIVEECLSNLQRPFDSFVISPIDDGDTYSYQSGEKINMIEAISDININDIDMPQWKYHFTACYNSLNNSKIERKNLKLLNYTGTLPQQVICFKTIKHANYAYVFNLIESANTFTFADGIRLHNKFILNEVNNFFNNQKSDDKPQRCHNYKVCRNPSCPSFFKEIDITDNEFNELRAYLYSYLNIDIRNKQFFLIKSLIEDIDTKDFVICIFDKKEEIKGKENEERSLCHSIQSGILTQFEDSILSIEDSNPFDETIRQMEGYKCDTTKPYIFLSFRSNNNTPNLCQPVINDFLKLKDKLNLWIDINNGGTAIIEDIKSAIKNENCIGAFVYFSEEYLKWADDSDCCYIEMKLINEKFSNNKKFIRYPILLNGLTTDRLKEIIHQYSGSGREDKILTCNAFFDYDYNIGSFGVLPVEYKRNQSHFTCRNNLKNDLTCYYGISLEL